MSKSTYRKGRKITSVCDFETCESVWFKRFDRTKHRSVLENLQYRTLRNEIHKGVIFIAEKKTETE